MGSRRDFTPLSEMGRESARRIAKTLTGTGASVVATSPYTRALESAHIIALELGVPLFVDPNLHDWLPVVDGGAALDVAVVDESIAGYLAGRIEGVSYETPQDLWERMTSVVASLFESDVREAVIVSHQEPICVVAGIVELEMGSCVTRTFDQLELFTLNPFRIEANGGTEK